MKKEKALFCPVRSLFDDAQGRGSRCKPHPQPGPLHFSGLLLAGLVPFSIGRGERDGFWDTLLSQNLNLGHREESVAGRKEAVKSGWSEGMCRKIRRAQPLASGAGRLHLSVHEEVLRSRRQLRAAGAES